MELTSRILFFVRKRFLRLRFSFEARKTRIVGRSRRSERTRDATLLDPFPANAKGTCALAARAARASSYKNDNAIGIIDGASTNASRSNRIRRNSFSLRGRDSLGTTCKDKINDGTHLARRMRNERRTYRERERINARV